MPYIEFTIPSKLSVVFRYTAKIYRVGYYVIIEADGVSHSAGIDLTVSRRTGGRDAHAVIFVENDRVYIEDLGSTNGTYVNATKIEPYKPVEISSSDTVTIGYYTTLRIVHEPTKEEVRKERDSRDIAISMRLAIQRCIIELDQGIEGGLIEFESSKKAFMEYLNPCILSPGICEAYNRADQIFQTLKADIYARTDQNIKSFREALLVLEKTLEKHNTTSKHRSTEFI
jgi:pSer/pThr/pTyr-binding forkhead associated (FHA) protein